MFGVYFFAGALRGGLRASCRSPRSALRRAGLLRGVVSAEHLHDLGKLLFAFTVFWAYIAFSQFFLIWYGNIPEETIWYRARLEGVLEARSTIAARGRALRAARSSS